LFKESGSNAQMLENLTGKWRTDAEHRQSNKEKQAKKGIGFE